MARDAEAAALRGIPKSKKEHKQWLHEEVQNKVNLKDIKRSKREERILCNEIRDYVK